MPRDAAVSDAEHAHKMEHVADAAQILRGNWKDVARAYANVAAAVEQAVPDGAEWPDGVAAWVEQAAPDGAEWPDGVPATVVSADFSPIGREYPAVLLRGADRAQGVFPVPDFCSCPYCSCSFPRDAASRRTDYLSYYRFSHPFSQHPDDYPKYAVRCYVADDVRPHGCRDGYLPMMSMSRLQ